MSSLCAPAVQPPESTPHATATNKQYTTKQAEWEQWCTSSAFDDGTRVTEEKIISFLEDFVHLSGNKKRKAPDGTPLCLTSSVYKGYVSAIVDLYKTQVALGINDQTHPRGPAMKKYLDAKNRKDVRRKRDECVDRGLGSTLGEYTPEELRRIGDFCMQENTGSALRNLCDIMLGHSMLLCGLTDRSWQLPDLFATEFQDEGPTECFSLIVLMDQGRKNLHGNVEYSSAVRHKDVGICAIGATALYLFHRFEMDGEEFPDFSDNRKWHGVHLLRGDKSRYQTEASTELSYATQRSSVKKVLAKCDIQTTRLTHLDGSGGAGLAEAVGLPDAQTRRIGDIGTETLEECYKPSLPLKTMRGLANFSGDGRSFHLPRAEATPPVALQRQIFPQVEEWLGKFESGEIPRDIAGQCFLKLLVKLRLVILQDSVVLKKKYPNHILWTHKLFALEDYRIYERELLESMGGGTITEARSALNVNLQASLPDVAALMNVFKRFYDEVNQNLSMLEAQVERNGQEMDRVCNMLLGTLQTLTSSLPKPATTFAQTSPTIPSASTSTVQPPTTSGQTCVQQVTTLVPPQSSPRPEGDPVPKYSLNRNLSSITDVWREYDTGLPGHPSVKSLESNYGTAWRKGDADRRYYSSRKVVYDEIKRIASEKQISDSDAAGLLEADRIRLGKSVDGMKKFIREQGKK